MVPPGGNHLWGESVRIRWWKVVSNQNYCHHVLSVKGFVNVWRNDHKQQQCHPHHLWGAIVRWWKVVSNPIGATSKPTASQFPVTANKRMKGEREFSSEFKATEKRGRSTFEEYIESGWKCESSFSSFAFVNFLHLYLPEVACWVTGRVKLWQSSASHGRPLQFPSKLPQKRWCAACCYVSRDGGRFVGEGGNFVPFCLKLKFSKVRGLILTLIYQSWRHDSRVTGRRLGHGNTECPWFFWFIFYIESY